ncbi:MAG: UDP-N-acetylmuramate dehydrogenase [bacterium]|nr:UDP-N-acetylmuramate dehydrogenase [bacterium]
MKNTITELLPGVRTNIPLAPYTSFRIGGKASYFFIANTKKKVQEALRACHKLGVPHFILGGGTNVLVADKGYRGLIILMRLKRCEIRKNRLYAEAGALMSTIVRKTGYEGLAGLEWAGGLPGTVGGAVRGNAGAFGGETKDTIVEVEALDGDGKVKKYSNAECHFEYRSSMFKKKNLVVLSATFALKRGSKKRIQEIARFHIRYRKEKHPLEYPNAGSIFQNCDLKNIPLRLRSKVQHVVKTDPFPVVPTAYLNAEVGLKGVRVGKAEISLKHPNYIVNKGKAKAADVLSLIQKAKQRVKKKFSVELHEEIQYVK